MAGIITEYPQFFTAGIYKKLPLLKREKYKDIIVNSLKFLVENKRIILYAFAIMINHIHLIWQMMESTLPDDLQRDFLKFTAQRIKLDLTKYHPDVLSLFLVHEKDRTHHFWKRRPLSIELRTGKVFRQKLDYIHRNPVRAGICAYPEDYKYSSARFYHTGVDNWGFLTHYRD
jgi:putative transposase